MQFTLRTLLLLVLLAAVLFAIETSTEIKVGLVLSASLACATMYQLQHGWRLGGVIVIVYAVVGLMLLGVWISFVSGLNWP